MMASTIKVGCYSKRVAAWIYAVVNPAVESLRRETGLLQHGNITWRYHNRQCEYVRPIRHYVEGNYRPIYDDFLADNPPFKKKFASHDQAVSRVEDAAGRYVESLVTDREFQALVTRSLEAYESHLDPSQPNRPSLQDTKRHLPSDLAEYLVNRVESLPLHYTTHSFWEDFRTRFQDFERRHAAGAVLPRVVKQLMSLSGRLAGDLENHRLRLCRKYDIPAAPVPPAQSIFEHTFSN